MEKRAKKLTFLRKGESGRRTRIQGFDATWRINKFTFYLYYPSHFLGRIFLLMALPLLLGSKLQVLKIGHVERSKGSRDGEGHDFLLSLALQLLLKFISLNFASVLLTFLLLISCQTTSLHLCNKDDNCVFPPLVDPVGGRMVWYFGRIFYDFQIFFVFFFFAFYLYSLLLFFVVA